MIGNSKTLSRDVTWNKLIKSFEDSDQPGAYIELSSDQYSESRLASKLHEARQFYIEKDD
jgi:hypothetical protein